MPEAYIQFLILVIISLVFGYVYKHFREKRRRTKAEIIGQDAVLILAYNWTHGYKSGLFSDIILHRSDQPHPQQIDQHYSAVVPSNTTGKIADGSTELSGVLSFVRPPSGILYIKNKYGVQNSIILACVVMIFYAVLFLDEDLAFIGLYKYYLYAAVVAMYLFYYFFLYRAEYVVMPYEN